MKRKNSCSIKKDLDSMVNHKFYGYFETFSFTSFVIGKLSNYGNVHSYSVAW